MPGNSDPWNRTGDLRRLADLSRSKRRRPTPPRRTNRRRRWWYFRPPSRIAFSKKGTQDQGLKTSGCNETELGSLIFDEYHFGAGVKPAPKELFFRGGGHRRVQEGAFAGGVCARASTISNEALERTKRRRMLDFFCQFFNNPGPGGYLLTCGHPPFKAWRLVISSKNRSFNNWTIPTSSAPSGIRGQQHPDWEPVTKL